MLLKKQIQNLLCIAILALSTAAYATDGVSTDFNTAFISSMEGYGVDPVTLALVSGLCIATGLNGIWVRYKHLRESGREQSSTDTEDSWSDFFLKSCLKTALYTMTKKCVPLLPDSIIDVVSQKVLQLFEEGAPGSRRELPV